MLGLAELRRRQGRWKEADAMFKQAELLPLALVGRASLALDQGDISSAVDLAEQFLRCLPPEGETGRTVTLEVLVQAYTRLGHFDAAERALGELRSIVIPTATEALRASLHFAEGIVAAARDDYRAARSCFESAVHLFERSSAPFETSRARLELAKILLALERQEAAKQEAIKALDALRAIGASGEIMRAEAFLNQIEASFGKRDDRKPISTIISQREVEILRLAGQGFTNRQIATELSLSEHTVHRHFSNIFNKLDCPSRAAAVAYAIKLGLV